MWVTTTQLTKFVRRSKRDVKSTKNINKKKKDTEAVDLLNVKCSISDFVGKVKSVVLKVCDRIARAIDLQNNKAENWLVPLGDRLSAVSALCLLRRTPVELMINLRRPCSPRRQITRESRSPTSRAYSVLRKSLSPWAIACMPSPGHVEECQRWSEALELLDAAPPSRCSPRLDGGHDVDSLRQERDAVPRAPRGRSARSRLYHLVEKTLDIPALNAIERVMDRSHCEATRASSYTTLNGL